MIQKRDVIVLRWMAAGGVVALFVLFWGNVPAVSMIVAGIVTLILVKVYYDAACAYYERVGYPRER